MSNKDNGGAAFPTIDGLSEDRNFDGNFTTYGDDGMTLRDYFAAKAMQAFLSKPIHRVSEGLAIPAAAYSVADAMLAERAK